MNRSIMSHAIAFALTITLYLPLVQQPLMQQPVQASENREVYVCASESVGRFIQVEVDGSQVTITWNDTAGTTHVTNHGIDIIVTRTDEQLELSTGETCYRN